MQLIILRHTGNRIKVSNQNLDSKKQYREMAPKSLFEVVKVKVKKIKIKRGPTSFHLHYSMQQAEALNSVNLESFCMGLQSTQK